MQETMSTLKLANGEAFTFAKDRHNSLVVDFIELFAPRYAQNAIILYLYDEANNLLIHECESLAQLGVHEAEQQELADIVLYSEAQQTLFLVEMQTGHGPISLRNKNALQYVFRGCHAKRIFVSVLFSSEEYKQFVGQLAWGTYVWLSQVPDHIMYFE